MSKPMILRHKDNMVWIDLEMSGLDPEKDRILEIATVVTDGQLNVLAEGPNFVIHQSPRVLNLMDAWNQREHKKSGLIERVKASKTTIEEAEEETLKFIRKYCVHKKAPLCGNSVHHDRRFLIRYMPKLIDNMSYRIVDVSSIAGVIARWYPANQVKKIPAKKKLHKAVEDVRESIEELRYLREQFFRQM